MRFYRWRILPGILLLFIITDAVSPAEDNDFPEIVIEQNNWQVGIAVLATENNDTASVSAASLIPRLIQDELSGIDSHRLTDAEKLQILDNAIEKKEIESYARLSSLYSGRDDQLFNLNAEPSSLKEIDKQILAESLVGNYWRNLSRDISSVPEIMHVLYPGPPDGGELWNVDSFSSEAFRKEAHLDVLIIGSIVKVRDYYGIRISALGPAGEDILWEGAGGENDLETISAEAGAAARSLILGRPWAAVTVQTDPPEAVISVNGKSAGVGLWKDSTMEPGMIVLEVTATGYAPEVSTVVLSPYEVKTIDVSLMETVQPQVLIRSEPSGASLRLGSIWLGRAPLSVNQPDRVMSVTVEKEGYATRVVPLYPEAEHLTIPLNLALGNPVEELAASRNKLYNSIAWFSFSLAPTIILLGVSQNYANMNINSSTPEDMDYSYNAYYLSYGLMWGSVAINVGFLTNVLFKLSRYLKAAEGLSD